MAKEIKEVVNDNISNKLDKIVRATKKGKIQRSNYEIEIVDINTVNNSIEVFARAWINGKQLGFGGDGSVDIERFRFLNPPTLVFDENGEIVHRMEFRKELNIPTYITRYREAPEEALLQSLEETISVMENKFVSSKIIIGKIGNTTTTIYASPSAYMFNTNASWSTLRADGTSVGYDTTSATEATLIGEKITNYNLARNRYTFDLSSLSGETISSGIFSVKSTTSLGSGAETTYPADGSLVGVSTPDNNTSDFGKFGTTRFADTDVTRAAFANGSATYKNWTLNAAGISAAQSATGGDLNLGIRMSNDYSDSTVPTARSYALGYWAASAGTTNDPKLVIEHTAASTFRPITTMMM